MQEGSSSTNFRPVWSTNIPLDSRLSCLMAENFLDMCDISTLCSLHKVLLFSHFAWIWEKVSAFMHKLPSQFLLICGRSSGHLVLRLASKSRPRLFRLFNHFMRGAHAGRLASLFLFLVFFFFLSLSLSLFYLAFFGSSCQDLLLIFVWHSSDNIEKRTGKISVVYLYEQLPGSHFIRVCEAQVKRQKPNIM